MRQRFTLIRRTIDLARVTVLTVLVFGVLMAASCESAIEETPGTTVGAGDTAPPSQRVVFAADARPDDGVPFVSWDTASTVPFLVSESENSGRFQFHLGTWNTDTGTVAISDGVLFSTSVACRVFWDGSERFVIAPRESAHAANLQVTVNDHRLSVQVPDLALRLPSGLHSLVSLLRDGGSVAYAYREALGRAVLEIQGGPLAGRTPLAPPDLPVGTGLKGPVALDTGSDSRVTAYVETTRAASKDGQ